ncbi:MAG: TerD family protein [Desulfovibrionaceae bacterium]|nr:TerD family protein [Desulfovibrionaceae bacterium]
MPISLQKGGNVSLSKEAPGLTQAIIGLGWDVNSSDGAAFDLDASCFLLGDNGKVIKDIDFIFYNNPKSEDGSVIYSGDNRTGTGEGDDEQITVDFTKVSPAIKKIAVVVTIHEAQERGQNFGQVNNAYVRLVNKSNNTEIVRYDLTENYSLFTAITVCEVYRRDNEWKFRALGNGFQGGLKPLAESYGVAIG